MRIFEYPYVVITIFIIVTLFMLLIGLFFTIKSVRVSKGTAPKGFCGVSKIKLDFEKAGIVQKTRSVVYVAVSLEGVKRLLPESRVNRMYQKIKQILFRHLCLNIHGKISVYSEENFVSFNLLESEEIEQVLQRCFEDISDILVRYRAVNLVPVHFGYIRTGSTDVSFKTALSRAKQACCIAEDNNVLFYQWNRMAGKDFERKINIEIDICSEIDNDMFFLEYQPMIDAKTKKIIGAEALSRLNSTTEGVLSPYYFLPAVHNVGLNEKFDYYIFEKNCKWISGDKKSRERYMYTINFSRYTLCSPDMADTIISIVEQYGVPFSCIAVEILEDKGLKDSEKSVLMRNISRLKAKGVMILLDDFGTGYTSFGDLTDFDIDIVKIDKTITQNAENPTGFVVLKHIIQTAHDLGFKTLCEGIETKEHKNVVVEAGCDILQGFYFYRPMPVVSLETLLSNQQASDSH